MDAHCDTLIILNCCHAGLAAVTADEDQGHIEPINRFRKELIGAGSWDSTTRGEMPNAMCEALDTFLKGPDHTISISTLVLRMNQQLFRSRMQSKKEERFSQPNHCLLARTERASITLGDLSAPPRTRTAHQRCIRWRGTSPWA